jgi:hypothetical protein
LFADVGLAPVSIIDFDFPIVPFTVNVDYMPPLPLPFSIGFFLQTPNPNFKHFGSLTDFYFAYSFDLSFVRNEILIEYNDEPVEIHYFDFRISVRRFFRRRLGIAVETGFKFDSLLFPFP